MWQRVQSVFIGIVILSLLVALFQPVWESDRGDTIYRLYPIYFMEKVKATPDKMVPVYFPFCATAILIVAGITIGIQQFRRFDNRLLQIKLGALNSGIIAVALICCVLFSRKVIDPDATAQWKYGISIWLIIFAAASNWIALRFIRKDEKLVKDSNRIR